MIRSRLQTSLGRTIALNALVSPKHKRGRALRFVGHMGNLHIQVFVDFGAVNFLNPSLTTPISLRINNSCIEPVAVANGHLCYTKGPAYNAFVNL